MNHMVCDVVNSFVFASTRSTESKHDGVAVKGIEPSACAFYLRIDCICSVDLDFEVGNSVRFVKLVADIGAW